jgi:hypothetical protein
MGFKATVRLALASFCMSLFAACSGGSIGSNQDPGDGAGGGDGGDGGSAVTVAAVTLTADRLELEADASLPEEGVTVTLIAVDQDNAVVPGANLQFSATSGQIQPLSTETDASGRGSALLTTAGNDTLRTITVFASAGGVGSTLDIEVVAPAANRSPVFRMGIVSGDSFTPGALLINQSPLSAGGSSGLRVDIVDTANGNLPFDGTAQVTFSSSCLSQGIAAIEPNPVAVFNGTASATYVARGCSGDDVITARAVVDDTQLTATGTIEVLPATIGSIEFIGADPTTIGIAGSGQVEQSTVRFRVTNQVGGPVVDQDVSFSLNSTVGGISLTPATGTTNTDGVVQTIVNSGTVNTAVRVTATTTQGDTTLTSQSEQLVISTGLPDQNSFSASAECFNIEGLGRDNIQTRINLLAADRFNNPVPDGTAISFVTEGGAVEPSCITGEANGGERGGCSVVFRSQDPRPREFVSFLPGPPVDDGQDEVGGQSLVRGPRAGRATVLVTAIGEESFVDLNGNGRYDDGEPFGDLGEAFRDDNGNGVYDPQDSATGFPGEEFLDFNSNGVRDAGNALFTGFLCEGPSDCDGTRSLTVRDEVTIVLSGSSPAFDLGRDFSAFGDGVTLNGSNIRVPAGNSVFIQFVLRDVNFQPLPAQTEISVTADGDAGDFVGTTERTVACTTDDSIGGNTYGFLFNTEAITDAAISQQNSSIELSVTAPSGLVSIFGFSITAVAPPPPAP